MCICNMRVWDTLAKGLGGIMGGHLQYILTLDVALWAVHDLLLLF